MLRFVQISCLIGIKVINHSFSLPLLSILTISVIDAIVSATPDAPLAKTKPAEIDEALKMPAGVSREEFFAKYCPPLPANHMPMIGETSGVDSLIRLRTFRGIVRDKWTDEDWRLHRWAYARLTERVDAQIGIVMEALKKSGLDKNTDRRLSLPITVTMMLRINWSTRPFSTRRRSIFLSLFPIPG